MTESEIQEHVRAACNTGNTRAWRNNIAKLNVRGRWINYGIPGPGGSDLIGFHTITIQPEHVGTEVAVFMAIECKNAVCKLRPEQENFLNFIKNAGGIAGVARSTEDAHAMINDYKPCLTR